MKRFIHIGLVLSLLLGLVPTAAVFADSNRLYVTPTPSQMNVGTSFTVDVKSYTQTAQATSSASGTVIYSVNYLQVSSISVGGSDYGSPTINQGTGTINFNGSTNQARSGLSQIFSITFYAKAAGTATVGFSSNSQVNGTTTTYASGSYTITNPSPPASSPSPSSTPKQSTAPQPAPVVTTPVVTNPPAASNDSGALATTDPTGIVDSVDVRPSYNYATITWKVNASNPSSSIVYGSSSTQLDKQGSVVKGDAGKFSSKITGLSPGTTYYFSISGGGPGTPTGTYSSIIPTAGFPVIINVTENNIAANGAQVQIGSYNYTTHADGKVTIGLAAGSYSGKITTDTATLNINLTVVEKPIPSDPNSTPESQSFAFDLKSSALAGGAGSGATIFAFVGILIGGTVVLVFGFLIFINIRRRKFDTGSDSYQIASGPSVIVEDGYSWQQETPEQPRSNLPPPPASELDAPHTNSVYLTEAEPLDMFEKAKLGNATPPSNPSVSTEQNPNSLHSTTP